MRATLVRPFAAATLLAAGLTSATLAQSLGAGPVGPPKSDTPAEGRAEPRAENAMPEAVAAILARSIEAMGGTDAVAKATDWSMVIDWDLGGFKRGGRMCMSGDDKYRYDEKREGTADLVIAMNGDFCWTVLGGTRAIRVSSSRAAQFRRWGTMHRALADLPNRFRSFELGEPTTFADLPCDMVVMRDKVHVSDVEPYGKYVAYFAKETGRLVGLETPGDRRSEGSDVLRFDEWKTFGDLQLFTVIHITRAGGASQTVRYAELAFGPIDATLFEVPEAVRNMPAPRDPSGAGAGSLLGTRR